MTKKTNDEILKEIMFADEVCEVLRISKETLKKWTMKNKIPHKKLMGRNIFFKSEIVNWIKSKEAA